MPPFCTVLRREVFGSCRFFSVIAPENSGFFTPWGIEKNSFIYFPALSRGGLEQFHSWCIPAGAEAPGNLPRRSARDPEGTPPCPCYKALTGIQQSTLCSNAAARACEELLHSVCARTEKYPAMLENKILRVFSSCYGQKGGSGALDIAGDPPMGPSSRRWKGIGRPRQPSLSMICDRALAMPASR